MSSLPSPAPEIPLPPTEDDLPHTDGVPLETELHRRQMNLLIESLENRLAQDRDDFYVGGNMFIYFSDAQVKKQDFRGPDFFAVIGDTTRRVRKSWVVWQEGGRTPDVVIELTSSSTEDVDRGEKKDIYAKRLKVAEYYIYDPVNPRLDAFRLHESGMYVAADPKEGGDVRSPILGFDLAVRDGRVGDYEGPLLRWLEDGDVLPTAQEEAEALKQRAETENQRTEAERQRIEGLEAELARYRAQFGELEPSDE